MPVGVTGQGDGEDRAITEDIAALPQPEGQGRVPVQPRHVIGQKRLHHPMPQRLPGMRARMPQRLRRAMHRHARHVAHRPDVIGMQMRQHDRLGAGAIQHRQGGLQRVDPRLQHGAVDPQHHAFARMARRPARVDQDGAAAGPFQHAKAHRQIQPAAPLRQHQPCRHPDPGLCVKAQPDDPASSKAAPNVTPAAVPSISTRAPSRIRPDRRA